MSYLLRFTDGPCAGMTFPIDKPLTRIGRSSSNDICVKDPELSRNHCQIELRDNGELWITDLASANQTFINDQPIESVRLRVNVSVGIGSSYLHIEEITTTSPETSLPPQDQPPKEINLGFDAPPETTQHQKNLKRAVIWPLTVLIFLCAIIFAIAQSGILSPEDPLEAQTTSQPVNLPCELIYERIEIDAAHAFRYAVHLQPDGTLSLKMNDVTGKSRTIDQTRKLTSDEYTRFISTIREVLSSGQRPEEQDIGRANEAEPTNWQEISLSLIENYKVETFKLQNRSLPEAWTRIREQIETQCNTLFGTWALNLSADELLTKAREHYNIAIKYDEERGLARINLSNAIRAYSESIYYMDSLDPRPDFYDHATEKKKSAEKALQKLCDDHNINAVRAINIKDWESARAELQCILELVPDRTDARNQSATAKLVEVEARFRQKTSYKR